MQIPGYTLEGLLGEGSSGKVYRARCDATGERVAIKILKAAGERRFEREIAILQALNHPNILAIRAFGRVDGRAYLVTELVAGTSLAELLPLRALGPAALVVTLAKLSEALAAAHASGVLHRDMKPGNVILDADMEPRLIDFGLAAFADDMGTLTRSGTSLGTPMYMAPEVLQGGTKFASEKGDVYALGVILYEGLTARHPFQGPDWPTTLQRITSGVAPEPPSVLPWSRDACLSALALDPARRLSARDFAQQLYAGAGSRDGVGPLPAPQGGDPRTPAWAVGSRLGPYVIEERIGEGGMGAVFLGRHERTQVRHALKVVRSPRPDRAKRLEREAQALAKVAGHSGVVGIHLFQTLESGQSFFALDYVKGTDLDRELKNGPLPIARALRIARQVAEALAHVHAQGIVHRDVKPGNVLLRAEDDCAFLTDFGLALDPEEQRLTASNAILGTPCFMAPEQASVDKEAVGPKSDVFSLGAVLYTMLVGKPPFERSHFVAVLEALLFADAISPRRQRPEISAQLEDMVYWTLEKDPDKRPDAQELGEALRALERGEGVSRSGSTRAGMRRLARRVGGPKLVLAGALSAIAVGGSVLGVTLTLQAKRRAGWEIEARAAIDAAEEALARFDAQSLPAYYDYELKDAVPIDTEALVRAQQALGPLARADGGEGSRLLSAAKATESHLSDALLRAQALAAIESRDFGGAQELLEALSPSARVALGALIRVRRGDEVKAEELVSDLLGWDTRDTDRLQLLAARVELDRQRGHAARRRLSAVSPQRGAAANSLLAEICVRDALAAARSADPKLTLRALAEAAALDTARAQEGRARAAAVVMERWLSGSSEPRVLIPLLNALNGAEGRLPQTAPVYVAAALAESHSPGGDPLPAARAFDRALMLDPKVPFPDDLLSWLGFSGARRLAQGDLRAGAEIYRACLRGGLVVSPANLRFGPRSEIRGGVVGDLVHSNPDDWAARALRGLVAFAGSRSAERDGAQDETRALARLAYDDLEFCVRRPEIFPKLRAHLEVQQLTCSLTFEGSDLQTRIEALEARPRFPELWRAYRIGALHFRTRRPQLALRYARLYVARVQARRLATTEGRLADDESGVNPEQVRYANGPLLDCLLACDQLEEARKLYAQPGVRESLSARQRRDAESKLRAD